MTQALLADPPAGPPPDAGPMGSSSFPLLMIGLVALFWVFVVLPGSRRQKKEQEALLKGLKRGSRVVTSSGILGTVVSVKDNEDEMVLRSEDARFKMRKSMVVQVLGSDETEAAK